MFLMELRKNVILRSAPQECVSKDAPRDPDRPAGSTARSCAPVAERVLAQKIEIAAAVGLQDLAAVEPGITALGHRRRCGLAAGQLVGRDQELDAALLDREPDAVAVPHLGERTAARRIRGYMK